MSLENNRFWFWFFSLIFLYLRSILLFHINWVKLLHVKGIENSKYKNYFLITRSYNFLVKAEQYMIWEKKKGFRKWGYELWIARVGEDTHPVWEIREVLQYLNCQFLKDIQTPHHPRCVQADKMQWLQSTRECLVQPGWRKAHVGWQWSIKLSREAEAQLRRLMESFSLQSM